MRIHVSIHIRRNLHVRENRREQEVLIKGAEGCIVVCMYIWMQAQVYVRWEVARHMNRVMRTSIHTVAEVSIKFVENEERKQNSG